MKKRTAKKAVKKAVKKPVKKVISTIKKSVPVKQKRRIGIMKKKTVVPTNKKRTVRRSAVQNKTKSLIPIIKEVGMAIAGGVGSSAIANQLPITNQKLKSALPLILGLLLTSTAGRKSGIINQLGYGMCVIGGVSLLKQFAPNIPMLAGEYVNLGKIPDYSNAAISEAGQYLDYSPESGEMGDMLQLGDDTEEYLSPASM